MSNSDLVELVKQRIENLRPKLLDLSRRNPLLATRLSPRSNSYIRVVDELPEILFYILNNGQPMRLAPLPDIDADPRDEDTKAFRDALANARITDETYQAELDAIDRDAEDYVDRTRTIERALKDRVREQLGLPPRPRRADVNLAQHARNNGINPSYELPYPKEVEESRYSDDDIQTLLLPKDLERKLNAITSKCRTWVQETGINVLHVAFGFLEWSEPNQTEISFAPLLLFGAQIEKKRTRQGSEFWIFANGDEPEVNAVLAEKMRLQFGIDFPKFEGGSIEEYFATVAEIAPKQITWRVRRQVVVGVFPSARMAMYHDIDPSHPALHENEIVRSLLAGTSSETASPFPEEYNVDNPDIERCVPCLVLDADSSQFSTLVDIAKGKNLAVEGPPGTGKSQTIVNAIAAALAEGKKVLFVAEKLAALNVVRSRLESIALGEFLLPLQAERSTREQVIASLRTRVEMRPPMKVRDYDRQIGEFRRLRELADYIELLTTPFAASGLSVHEILGKSIATSSHLENIPREVLSECDIPESLLNAQGIEHLRSLGVAVEKAARAAAHAAPYWKSTKLVHPERFKVEEACNLALSAARSYRSLSEQRTKLSAYGIAPQTEEEILTILQGTLQGFSKLPSEVPQELCVQLIEQEGTLERLCKFLSDCEDNRRSERALTELFDADLSGETLSIVKRVTEVCTKASLKTLDRSALEAEITTRRERLEKARGLENAMVPLVRVCPEAVNWSFESIAKAHKAIVTAGSDALMCRNAATGDPAASMFLRKLCAEGYALQAAKSELETRVSLSVDASFQDLMHAISCLRSGGAFGFLFKEYRRAKKLARSLLTLSRFNKREALEQLEALASYRRAECEFVANPQAVALFGVHFRGTGTDFSLFERLAQFYEVAQSFSSPELRSLRAFLRDADIEDLELIPSIPSDVRVGNFQTLQRDLVSAQQELDDLIPAVNILRPLLKVFRKPASLDPSILPELERRLETHLSQSARLDQDRLIAEILGEVFRGARTPTASLMEACRWAGGTADHRFEVAAILRTGRPLEAVEHIGRVLDASSGARSSLLKLCEAARLDEAHFTKGRDAQEIASFLEGAANDRDGLFAHASLAFALEELADTGTYPLVMYRMKEDVPDGLGVQLGALAVRQLSLAVFAAHGSALARYSGSRLDDLRTALAQQDKKLLQLSRQQLRWKLYAGAKPPYGNGTGKKSTWTELALINNEINKQQRFIPVRDLTQRAGRALLELKPCWMMSPLAVAQYVPKDSIKFDLCIIDECVSDASGVCDRSSAPMQADGRRGRY